MSSKRQKGAELLRKGYSYNQVKQKIKVSKSTLNYWFKQLSQKEQEKIKVFRIKNWKKAYKKHAQRIKGRTLKKEKQTQKKAAQEIKNISKKELFLVGVALYWAEGGKKNRWGLQFSNSDPEMISLIMKFFRKICCVKEEKFYMQLILHENIEEKKAINYWAKITQVPEDQFKKPCYSLSKSSKKIRKKRQLPYGTLQVRIHDKKLTHKIYGYVKGLKSAGLV